jgi:hypothetical protein
LKSWFVVCVTALLENPELIGLRPELRDRLAFESHQQQTRVVDASASRRHPQGMPRGGCPGREQLNAERLALHHEPLVLLAKADDRA